jgi:hypothetical protein
VDYKPRPWQLVVVIALICGILVAAAVLLRSRALTPAAYLRRMPQENTLVLWIDFAELRQDGLLGMLAGAKAAEDPEYKVFVRETRFDYNQDLDTAMAAFAPDGNFFLAKGRFDWKSIRSYAESMSGNCVNSLCRVEGSGPDRRISFLPVRRDVMAIAASPDDYAALRLTKPRPGPDPPVPSAPVWLAFPGSLLKSGNNVPEGARSFARIVENAPSVTVSFVPRSDQISAQLDVRCSNEQSAKDASAQLTEATRLVRSLLERENLKPNPSDASGVLGAGTFHADGAHVYGTWPIPREYLQKLLGN